MSCQGFAHSAKKRVRMSRSLPMKGSISRGLRNPFLFVVCGEVNAGKSTLLNGIFGEDFCRVNVLPETEKVQWYRWGSETKNINVTPILEERYRPIDFLQDFNIVDTPGTNSVVAGHQAITEKFLPIADLILFVFPVSNPWGAATWDFISRLPVEVRDRVAIVIQQSDLRADKDIQVIIEHLNDLCEQKLGQTVEVFPVSAKQALDAKAEMPFRNDLWKESGFPSLESFISKMVLGNPQRKKVLREVRDSTQQSLREIEDVIEAKTTELEKDMVFLRELESEVDRNREANSNELSQKFAGLVDVFTDEAQASMGKLKSSLSVVSSLTSLFSIERVPGEIEHSLVEAVKGSVQTRAENDGHDLVNDCRSHWQTVVPRIEERLGIQAPDFEKETNGLSEARERFGRRLGRSSRQAVVNLKLRGMLDHQIEQRRNVLRRFMMGCLSFVILGGLAGAFRIHPWSFILIGIGLLTLGGAIWYARRSGEEICKSFEEKITLCRQPFATALGSDYKDGLRDFYVGYGKVFENVRRHIAKSKQAIQPQLQKWNDHFLELKAIEQEL